MLPKAWVSVEQATLRHVAIRLKEIRMSPLFRKLKVFQGEDPTEADEAEMQAELARLSALALEQLAAAVLTETFGPSGHSVDGAIWDVQLVDPFLPESVRTQNVKRDRPSAGHEEDVYWRMVRLLREGLQVLEHAGLVLREPVGRVNSEKYRLTRLGRDALERGNVEQTIRARGSQPGSDAAR
jgi:hypothetical protein